MAVFSQVFCDDTRKLLYKMRQRGEQCLLERPERTTTLDSQ